MKICLLKKYQVPLMNSDHLLHTVLDILFQLHLCSFQAAYKIIISHNIKILQGRPWFLYSAVLVMRD